MENLTPPQRSVELVLVTPQGNILGRLPRFTVSTPWWNDVEPVVGTAKALYGIDVIVLRLLTAETGASGHGNVTYLAETPGSSDRAKPWKGSLDEQPMRHSFARRGGPASDLAWADSALEAAGMSRTAAAVQVRTWNLSSLWRIPTRYETVWMKVVPPFFAHEGAVLNQLAGSPVPRVIGFESGRMLLGEVVGEDLYGGASLEQSLVMITQLVGIQAAWIGREDELLALGLPDRRLHALGSGLDDVLERTTAELPPEDVDTLRQFLADLSLMGRWLAECGIPPTLVHGDFHPGNVRGRGLDLTILDWGDSGVSHPLLDQMAWLRHVKPEDLDTVRAHWNAEWQRHLPASDPETASRLIQPVSAAYQAVIRQRFLDNIEPAEHFYHLEKRAMWLRKAAELYRAVT